MALGLTGLGGLNSVGGAPMGTAAPNTQLQPSQALKFDVPTQNPDLSATWMAQDVANPTIDWSLFSPLSSVGYDKVLDRDYKKRDPILGDISAFSMGRVQRYNPYSGQNETFMPKQSGIIGKAFAVMNPDRDAVQGRFAVNPNAINFADPTIDKAIDAMNAAIYGKAQPVATWDYNNMTNDRSDIFSMAQAAMKPKETAALNMDMFNKDTWTSSPAELIRDSALRDQLFSDTAKQYGMTADELKDHYNTYAKAYDSVADPVGANWQDLKRMGATYANDLLPSIRRYSGYDDNFFNKLNNSVSEGTRNSANYLSPEYFALHTVSPNNQYRGKLKGTELVGNTNPRLMSMFDQYYRPTTDINMRKSESPMGITLPYQQTDWRDFLGAGVTSLNATQAQKSQAQRDYERQQRLLGESVKNGGVFNLWREAGAQPYSVTKTEGGKWRPRNSGYTNQLNIAQNFLNKEGDGSKTFQDLGYNPDDAWRSGFYFDKKKKNQFGSVLGTALGLASFIPGPVGIAARIGSAVNSVANKDYLGAALTGLSLFSGASNPLTKVTSALSKSAKIPMSLANSIVQGGIGGLGAVSRGGNFIRGAAGAGLGSFASGELGSLLSNNGLAPELAGAVSGAGGSLINSRVQGATSTPLLLSTAQGALSGYGRGSDIRKRQQLKRLRT